MMAVHVKQLRATTAMEVVMRAEPQPDREEERRR